MDATNSSVDRLHLYSCGPRFESRASMHFYLINYIMINSTKAEARIRTRDIESVFLQNVCRKFRFQPLRCKVVVAEVRTNLIQIFAVGVLKQKKIENPENTRRRGVKLGLQFAWIGLGALLHTNSKCFVESNPVKLKTNWKVILPSEVQCVLCPIIQKTFSKWQMPTS